jgi:hypothetical protein
VVPGLIRGVGQRSSLRFQNIMVLSNAVIFTVS